MRFLVLIHHLYFFEWTGVLHHVFSMDILLNLQIKTIDVQRILIAAVNFTAILPIILNSYN